MSSKAAEGLTIGSEVTSSAVKSLPKVVSRVTDLACDAKDSLCSATNEFAVETIERAEAASLKFRSASNSTKQQLQSSFLNIKSKSLNAIQKVRSGLNDAQSSVNSNIFTAMENSKSKIEKSFQNICKKGKECYSLASSLASETGESLEAVKESASNKIKTMDNLFEQVRKAIDKKSTEFSLSDCVDGVCSAVKRTMDPDLLKFAMEKLDWNNSSESESDMADNAELYSAAKNDSKPGKITPPIQTVDKDPVPREEVELQGEKVVECKTEPRTGSNEDWVENLPLRRINTNSKARERSNDKISSIAEYLFPANVDSEHNLIDPALPVDSSKLAPLTARPDLCKEMKEPDLQFLLTFVDPWEKAGKETIQSITVLANTLKNISLKSIPKTNLKILIDADPSLFKDIDESKKKELWNDVLTFDDLLNVKDLFDINLDSLAEKSLLGELTMEHYVALFGQDIGPLRKMKFEYLDKLPKLASLVPDSLKDKKFVKWSKAELAEYQPLHICHWFSRHDWKARIKMYSSFFEDDSLNYSETSKDHSMIQWCLKNSVTRNNASLLLLLFLSTIILFQ